jgi:hypothetical protein
MDACAFCITTEDLRRCARCWHWFCRAHACRWPMWRGWVETRICECWPCALADTRRIIAEARVLAGNVEPAPPFEE